jgi:DHA1 family multidrug resistance protein-like MFS transporter
MKEELKAWCQQHHCEALAQLAVHDGSREALLRDGSVVPALEAVMKDGLSEEAAIGADMSAMGIADLTLVPLAGWAMDAKGRKTAGVPAMFIMAGGFALLATLPLVSEITGLGAAWLVLASAVIIGAGSGCASGLNQVLGMDHAPSGAADSATFLSVWRMMSDSGALIGPVLAGLIAEQWNVYVASLCVSTVGMLGALWLLCVVKTWSSDT